MAQATATTVPKSYKQALQTHKEEHRLRQQLVKAEKSGNRAQVQNVRNQLAELENKFIEQRGHVHKWWDGLTPQERQQLPANIQKQMQVLFKTSS